MTILKHTANQPTKKRVIIVGGGVAGLSAAHHLAEYPAKFEIHVLEKSVCRSEVGGKAVSRDVPRAHPGDARPRFIAEHGFHLFSHFYRHVTATMKSLIFDETVACLLDPSRPLPNDLTGCRYKNPDETVWGNLHGCTHAGYAADGVLRTVQRPFPETGLDFVRAIRAMLGRDAVATETDIVLYAWMLIKFITSCKERREEVYEHLTWPEYLGVEKGLYSEQFSELIKTLPRCLSAMRSDKCSARSVGVVTLQVLFDMAGEGGLHMESVLRGSTEEMWLEPWRRLLFGELSPRAVECKRDDDLPDGGCEGNEVDRLSLRSTSAAPCSPPATLHTGVQLEGFIFDGVKLTGLRVSAKKQEWLQGLPDVRAQKEDERRGVWTAEMGTPSNDYIIAVPLEVLHRMLNTDDDPDHPYHAWMREFDESLARLAKMDLSEAVAPMVGIQFFLKKDVQMCNGHVFYPKSPWALTSISQAQFWEKQLPGTLSEFIGVKGPSIGGILSVIISDWNAPAPARSADEEKGKSARECTMAEIKREVWLQLKDALNAPGKTPLLDEDNLWYRASPPDSNKASLDTILEQAAELDPRVLDEHDNVCLFDTDGAPLNKVTPLFVHPVGSFHDRPDAQLRIPNMLLAADYVRTYTDIATMEAANEAARRAVLAILWREFPTPGGFPELWPLNEGAMFEGARALDRLLFKAGKLPHVMDAPQVMTQVFGSVLGNVAQIGIDLLGMRGRIKVPAPMALSGGGFALPRFGPALTVNAIAKLADTMKSLHVEMFA